MFDRQTASAPERLTGWGCTAPSVATVVRVRSAADTGAALASAGVRGATARGLGRSYGDAAQNGGGTVLDCTCREAAPGAGDLAAIDAIDAARGTIAVGGGASLQAIQRAVLPNGWTLPVLPGTWHVTAGGAIASDVHGKSHHVDGSFGAHVEAFTLALPGATGDAGEVREVSRASDPALFDATTGGMGLTGVIVAATLRLAPVETRFVRFDSRRTPDLDATMRALVEGDAGHRYSVAWIDLAGSRGRGIVSTADHARLDDLPAPLRDARLDAPERRLAGRPIPRPAVPPIVPVNLVTRVAVRWFNEAWFRRPEARGVLQPLAAYLAPLDAVRGWNRLYGPRGLIQYQFALPRGEEAELRAIVEAIAGAPAVPALAVLKRFGPGRDAPLSFPIEGWTLAVDFPAVPSLGPFLDRLDRRVAAAGGRVYLAKDARMRAEMVPLMYPRIREWRETRARVDPRGVLTSDLDRRLQLTAATMGGAP